MTPMDLHAPAACRTSAESTAELTDSAHLLLNFRCKCPIFASISEKNALGISCVALRSPKPDRLLANHVRRSAAIHSNGTPEHAQGYTGEHQIAHEKQPRMPPRAVAVDDLVAAGGEMHGAK